jgi:uncharacterized protein YhaN
MERKVARQKKEKLMKKNMEEDDRLKELVKRFEKAHANDRPMFGDLLEFPDEVVLRRNIYTTNLIELVKTIEKETNELFKNLPDKIDLQNNLTFFCISFMGELDEVLTDVALDMVKTFLTQINLSANRLTAQDIHRIIMVLALMIYAECNNKKAEKLETLVKNMDLIK